MDMKKQKDSLVYFDCEFTGLHKNTTLISIGLVDNNGRTFYAESTDYDSSQITEWIWNNVMTNLTDPDTVLKGDHWTMTGGHDEIRLALFKWLLPIVEKTSMIQFVADVCHYDFVLLIELLCRDGETADKMSEHIVPYCIDLNQVILDSMEENDEENIFMKAFNVSREEFSGDTNDEKHNALHDAEVCQRIFNKHFGIMD